MSLRNAMVLKGDAGAEPDMAEFSMLGLHDPECVCLCVCGKYACGKHSMLWVLCMCYVCAVCSVCVSALHGICVLWVWYVHRMYV
jgi:hypothetical protein